MLHVYDVKTEYRNDPYGIDAPHPRFSWKLSSDRRGVVQVRYRILANSDRGLLWDSGYCDSADQRIRYDGLPLNSRETVRWTVWVEAADEEGLLESAISLPAFFTMGILDRKEWIARWIEPEGAVDREARKPSPYLRKRFWVRPGLRRAVLCQTAHGLYETWINGMLGTEDKFKPGLTSYYYRIQYHMADVTDALVAGENVWAVALGDGWWRGVTGGTLKNNFGEKLHYFGQLELTYEDGTVEIIGSDETFRTSSGGLLASDLQMGDLYDARLEPDGWKKPGFDDSGWLPVHLAEVHTEAELIPSRSVPVREKERFLPDEFRDSNGARVLDFGQNIAGYVKIVFRHTEEGQKIRMVFGEDIDASGAFSQANIRQSNYPMERFQEIEYCCKGTEEESYVPLFSYFGFRYMLLEGYETSLEQGDVIAVALYSELEETGDFTCSDPLIDRLVRNSRWSQKGNFLDVAVDCPTREKNAWTGDNQIYARTAADFMNVYPFYEKWLQDMTLEQYESGKIGITFPSTSSPHDPNELAHLQKTDPLAALAGPLGEGSIGEDCAGWGDAAAWLPYILYLCYGDDQILRNQYGTAKRWADHMLRCAKEPNPLYEDAPQYHTYTDGEPDAEYIYDTRMHFGEWQEPIEKKTTGDSIGETFQRWIREGKPLVATAYMCRSCENVAAMAEVLGKYEDADYYAKKAARIRTVYETYLIEEDGTIEPGHQAAYVRALAFGLCSGNKKEQVRKQLIREIETNNYKLNTGFLSTPFLLPVLVEMGEAETAYRLLQNTEVPGWLHPVLLGATTIPESWNAYDVHDSSYNHYSYGAVCEFLFSHAAGIDPLWGSPGYRVFKLEPIPGGTLTYVNASYESPYGTIRSNWSIKDDVFSYECEVPVGTTAYLYLPDGEEHRLGSGTYEFHIEYPSGEKNDE